MRRRHRIAILVQLIVWLILELAAVQVFAADDCGMRLTHYAGYTIWRSDNLLVFASGMTIDADGSPRAYHPDDVSGLDDLHNAGHPGHWDALATVNGEPVLQGPDDPAPSYFVSTTSLEDRTYPATSPAHYVDAEQVPYIALPPDIDGPELGDVAYVYNARKDQGNAAIFADQSPSGKLGEGSIALAKLIGINADARRGGVEDGVLFVIFLHSGQHTPLSISELEARSEALRDRLEVDDAVQCILDAQ